MIPSTSGTQAQRTDFTAAASPPKPLDAVLRQGALCLVVIWLILAALPLLPAPIVPGLDPGWVLGLNLAHSQGLVHGKDIVWTYGPLAYLAYPDPSGHSMYPVLFFRLGIYLLWAVAMLRLVFAAANRLMAAAMVVLIGVSAILDPLMDHLGLTFFTWALLVVVDRSKWRTLSLAVLAFLAALACMVKGNLGVEAACLFASVAAISFFEAPAPMHWKWPTWGPVLLFPVLVVLLYAAGTGSVGSLPAYIRNSLEVASGYSEEMSFNGPAGQVYLALIGIAVLFFVLPLTEKPVRTLAAGFLPALFYTFFSFKSCMVRQDGHAADVQLRIALAALFLLALARTRLFFYLTLGFQAVCILIAHHYIYAGWPSTDAVLESRLTLQGNWPMMGDYLHWSRTWADWERQGRENLSPLRVTDELRSAIGQHPIEVLPWEVTRVAANNWTWSPRPIFQTYSAYTPRLDRINSDHLKSARAADFALLNWDEIDSRHPFLDTPLSWQTQLDLYQTVTTDSDLLLLGRRPTPRFERVEPIGSETATTWDRVIRVPQGADPVTVSARINRSLSGRLRGLLFRSNPLWIEITRQSGKTERYRAVRANLAEGVIINQFPANLAEIAVLAGSGCALSDPVVSFSFQTESPGEFDPDIRLEWARLVRRAEPPAGCVQITRSTAKAPVWGGVVSVPVSAGAGATWTAASNESWVSIPQEGAHTGNAIVDTAVLRNPGSQPRQGTMVIGGRICRIFQAGPGATQSNRASLQFGYYGSIPSIVLPPDLAAKFELTLTGFKPFSAAEDQPGQPVLGDWTGDGRIRIGIFSGGRWYLDLNGNGRWDGKEGGDGIFAFGLTGDIAVPGDWAGDGKTRLAVFRKGEWAFDMNGNMAYDTSDKFIHFGLEGDVPVVSKWSHDRMDRVGIFRNGIWFIDSNGDGIFQRTDEHFQFGLPGDIPLVSFGNGRVGVFRQGTCILSPTDTKEFDPKAVVKVPCGSSPLIAAW